jgi:IS1 family transposase
MILDMNRLPVAKRAQMLQMLCEGNSMRSVSRLAGASFNTVAKLLADAGQLCAAFHDEMVQNVKAQRVQCDEIWSFCYAKKKNVTPEMAKTHPDAGDVWTWTALDSDSKLIVSYLVGGRDYSSAMEFMRDASVRLANRVQLTTDGLKHYLTAVDYAFGTEVDFAQLVKYYGEDGLDEKRYSPAICTGCEKKAITGNPDPKHISTSHVERSNLSMRMHMRRFTRLTNAFTKKVENHAHMVSLYTVWYNFIRNHKTVKSTPAQAAGISDRPWSLTEIVELMDQVALVPATQAK